MPIVSTKEILGRAFQERYGVGAFNMVNDLTLEAVLAAAAELKAPVITQTSVKTVKSIGLNVLHAMFREMASPLPIPVSLLFFEQV
jgi:fructose/tagatose bisphosphate aldolase